ncbi:MAG TPA: hypothetical protein VFG53_15730 [Anaeromyxobacter sp.]|nr:hypothetical protein [Anaeromyxobacter sp.]
MLPLAFLAAGLAFAAVPARTAEEDSRGLPLVPIDGTLEVEERARSVRLPLEWQGVGGGEVAARAATREWEALVRLVPEPGGARSLEAAVVWRVASEEQRIALSLSWPSEAASAVDRSLRFVELPSRGALRVERGTPLLVLSGGLLLSGGPGLSAARVERTPDGVRVTLFWDDASARPFSTFESCYEKLPQVPAGEHLSWGSFDPRTPRPFAPRAPGQVDRLRAEVFPVSAGAPFVPVVVERWPRGSRGAVVFTDHADRTDPEALRAVLWGRSGGSVSSGAAGFLGRGLKLTRTFFVHGKGGSLDDPESRRLADELALAGSEVALHSITDERDTRDSVRAGVAAVARWAPVTWIDHEPYTNCEAISAQGWQDRGPYGIRDVLAQSGIRWIWAAGDEGRGEPRVYDLFGGRPDEARAAIGPFPLDDRLWMFRSSLFFAPPEVLAAALSDAELLALEEARGLFVAHTYLGASARTTHSEEHRRFLAVRSAPSGELVIDPALDGALARIAEQVRLGRLASLTVSEAGDRLRALGDVEVSYRPDGAAEIQNRGAVDIPGLTLAVSVPPEVELSLDGAGLLSREDGEETTRIWFDLPAGGRAVLRAFHRLFPLPFFPYP